MEMLERPKRSQLTQIISYLRRHTVFATRQRETLTNGRLLLAAVFVATVTIAFLFAAGASFSLFSATSPTQSNTISAGSVTLTSTAGGTCTVSALLPGASGPTCTLQATYSGTVSAYLGVDVLIATKPGNGGTNLYNPNDSTNDLQVHVTSTSPSVTYFTPSTTVPTGVACNTIVGSGYDSSYTCYRLTDLLVSQTPFTNASSLVTFSTSVSLPSTTTTGYRGGSAAIVVTSHAVQSNNNGTSTSSCTPGQTCAAVGNWG